jgi:hypothetical protein
MSLEYVQAALRHAKYEIPPDDGSYYGEIPQCRGVYANAPTLEECREELRELSFDATVGCNRYLGTRHRLSTPSWWTSEYVDRPAQGVSAPPQVA